MKISKQQVFKAYKKAEREIDIEEGANINYHRVHKSKKSYDRKISKKMTKRMFD